MAVVYWSSCCALLKKHKQKKKLHSDYAKTRETERELMMQ